MLLAIDVGNTNIVLGLFDGAELTEHWRIATDARRTADELALMVNGLLALSDHHGKVTGIACCSTVPAVLNQVRAMCARRFLATPVVIVEPGVRTGVPILMDNPKEVGADRIVNALAAHTVYGGPAIVVDFGTSTNVDAVGPDGQFLGGALAPGLEVSLDALASRAAQLRSVELTVPAHAIGKNTVAALQSGLVLGFAGLVDGLVSRIAAELVAQFGRPPVVVGTGGLAALVAGSCSSITEREPDLTVHGLRLAFERHEAGLRHPPSRRSAAP